MEVVSRMVAGFPEGLGMRHEVFASTNQTCYCRWCALPFKSLDELKEHQGSRGTCGAKKEYQAKACSFGQHEAEVSGVLVQLADPHRDPEWEARVTGFAMSICKHCRSLYVERKP